MPRTPPTTMLCGTLLVVTRSARVLSRTRGASYSIFYSFWKWYHLGSLPKTLGASLSRGLRIQADSAAYRLCGKLWRANNCSAFPMLRPEISDENSDQSRILGTYPPTPPLEVTQTPTQTLNLTQGWVGTSPETRINAQNSCPVFLFVVALVLMLKMKSITGLHYITWFCELIRSLLLRNYSSAGFKTGQKLSPPGHPNTREGTIIQTGRLEWVGGWVGSYVGRQAGR